MTMVGLRAVGSVYILPAYLVRRRLQCRTDRRGAGVDRPAPADPDSLVPRLMQRFDTRYIAFTGLMIFAYSCFMNTAMVARLCRRSTLDFRISCAPSRMVQLLDEGA